MRLREFTTETNDNGSQIVRASARITDDDNQDCIAPGSLDTSLSHAAGLSDIAVCHA